MYPVLPADLFELGELSDRAGAGRNIGEARTDGEESRRDRDAELAGQLVAGDDRPGHLDPCVYRPAA